MIAAQDIKALGILFRRFAGPYWLSLVVIVCVSMVASLLMSLRPLIFAPAMDTALSSARQPAESIAEINLNNLGATILAWSGIDGGVNTFYLLSGIIALFIGIVVVSAGLNFLSLHLMRWIRTGIANDMQSAMYKHLLSLSMPFFVKQRGGELPNRFVFDVVQTAQSFDPVVRGLLESTIQIVIYGIILIKTDPYTAVAVGGVIVVQMWITRYLQRKLRTLTEQSFDTYSRIGSLVQEPVQTIRVVKSFCAERFEHSRLMRELSGLKVNSLMFGFYKNSEIPLRDIANGVTIGAILLVAFNSLSANRLTASGFVMFVLVAGQAIIPVSKLGEALVMLQIFLGSSTRVVGRLNVLPQPALQDGNVAAKPFTTSICLEKVSFSYEPAEPDARRRESRNSSRCDGRDRRSKRSREIKFGRPDIAAIRSDIRGPSRITAWTSATIGKKAIAAISVSYHRSAYYLIPVSLKISLTDGPWTWMKSKRAAQIANAEEFIQQFPEAYETMVGDRGIRLSGGQRQRIAIARAVYGRPEILIFDEATSSLDSESEKQVQAAIDQITKGITAIVIAHRLSTVIKADTIVVLNDGKIEAMGAHSVLLETSLFVPPSLYRAVPGRSFRQ